MFQRILNHRCGGGVHFLDYYSILFKISGWGIQMSLPWRRCLVTCGFGAQVSIEYGLAELMNNVAIRNPRKPDSDEPWHLPFEKLYSILPNGVVDTSVHSILPQVSICWACNVLISGIDPGITWTVDDSHYYNFSQSFSTWWYFSGRLWRCGCACCSYLSGERKRPLAINALRKHLPPLLTSFPRRKTYFASLMVSFLSYLKRSTPALYASKERFVRSILFLEVTVGGSCFVEMEYISRKSFTSHRKLSIVQYLEYKDLLLHFMLCPKLFRSYESQLMCPVLSK